MGQKCIFILLTDITFTLICILIAKDHFFSILETVLFITETSLKKKSFVKLNYGAKRAAVSHGG